MLCTCVCSLLFFLRFLAAFILSALKKDMAYPYTVDISAHAGYKIIFIVFFFVCLFLQF